jgi:molybdenum cofactor guanylyltransferase
MMQAGGIILCGGTSRRMGTPKAMLPFGPEKMLQRVVRLMGQAVQPLVVVAAPTQTLPELPPEVLLVRDREPGQGPLEGLRAGLVAIRPQADAAYVTGCDVPLLQPAFVQRMIGQLGTHEIAVPVEGRFYHPLAAVYRTGVVPQIEWLLDQQLRKPRLLFDRVPTCEVPVERLRDVDPELLTLANLNQPEDYLAALALAGFEASPMTDPVSDFTVRRATNADIAAIRAVLYAVRDEYGVLSEIAANDPELDDMETSFFRPGGHFEVVVDDAGRIVGCAGLYPLSPRRAELCKMYIERSARGRGLGRRLLENLLEAARRNGFHEVWLETNSSLTDAITLYTQYGFVPVEPEHLLPKCDQAFLLRLE